jgi:hypothetical protein
MRHERRALWLEVLGLMGISGMLFCGTNICKFSEESVFSIFMVEESDVRVKWYRFSGASAKATDHCWFHQSMYPGLTFVVTKTVSPSASLIIPGDGCSRFLRNVSIYPSIRMALCHTSSYRVKRILKFCDTFTSYLQCETRRKLVITNTYKYSCGLTYESSVSALSLILAMPRTIHYLYAL